MAQIGSLTVDLTLKSAQFVADLAKSSEAVKRNTSAMAKSFAAVHVSVGNLTKGLGAFGGAAALRKISRMTEESIKLAATWDGPLKESAQNFLRQTEQFNNAFEFGIAQGFLEQINGRLGDSETSLRAINEVGSQVGSILGQGFAFASQNLGPLADGLGKVVTALEYISTKTPGQAVDDILGRNQGIAQIQSMVGFDAIGEKLGTGTSAWDAYKNSIESTNKALAETSRQINVAFPDIEKLAKQQRDAAFQTAESWLGVGDTFSGALATMFKEHKGFALTQAGINTAEAITKSLAAYGMTPLGIAAAAAAATAGAAQVAAIMSAQPGSARKAPISGSGAARASGGSGGGGGGRSGPAQNMTVILRGEGGFSREQVRGLMDQMQGLLADGHSLSVN